MDSWACWKLRNSLDMAPASMPMPVSRTLMWMHCRPAASASAADSAVAVMTTSPCSVNLTAFANKFASTCAVDHTADDFGSPCVCVRADTTAVMTTSPCSMNLTAFASRFASTCAVEH